MSESMDAESDEEYEYTYEEDDDDPVSGGDPFQTMTSSFLDVMDDGDRVLPVKLAEEIGPVRRSAVDGKTLTEAAKLVDEVRTGVEAFFTTNSVDETPGNAESDPGTETELPIGEYATLTAVEVIPLLSELDDEQLDTIEAFERANRNRSTVLNRIRQRRS